MPLLIVAALVVVYLILGILYESYIHPLTILSTLPSAGVGALAMLLWFGYDFSLIALIGIILLIGIVKKNGIMLVDFAIVAERQEGIGPREAIRKAALLRFRPILMTTMAALLGGIPLMFGTGTGSEIRQPLGYAMVGGLAVSQVLTLFTTPVIYIYLDTLATWLSGGAHGPEAKDEASEDGRRRRGCGRRRSRPRHHLDELPQDGEGPLRLVAEQVVAALRETLEPDPVGRQGGDEGLADGGRHQRVVRAGHDQDGAAYTPEHGAEIQAALLVAGPVEVERGVVAHQHAPQLAGSTGLRR